MSVYYENHYEISAMKPAMDLFSLLSKSKIPTEITEITNEIHSLLLVKDKTFSQQESKTLEKRIHAAVKATDSLISTSFSNESNEQINNLRTAKGVLLWSQLERTIGEVKYDSFGSRYLTKFPEVRSFNKSDFQNLCRKVKARFLLSDNELIKLKQEVEFLTSNLYLKNLIVEFIVKKLALGISHCQIFRSLTGCSALDHEKIDLTITDATIFFTFDFEDNGLDPSSQYSLSDQENLRTLLDKLDMFSNTERTDFPAVGKWSHLEVNANFLAELSLFVQENGLEIVSDEVIAKTIFTMIYLLPRKNAESFFVHDAYGHSWQESICEFEHLYQYINSLNMPIDLSELKEKFESERMSSLNSEGLFFYWSSYYIRQLSVAQNAILAEFTADAMEYHLQAILLQEKESIPTSSKMRDFSLFLDLSLNDTIKHIGSIAEAIGKEFNHERENQLAMILAESGLNPESVSNIIQNAKEQFKPISQCFSKPASGELRLIERLIFAQILRIYVYVDLIAKTKSPTVLHQQLLILTTHFQTNPETGFWNLDRLAESFEFCD